MKRFFLLAITVPGLLISCAKKDDGGCSNQDPALEVPAINTFAQQNDIDLIKDSSDIYYHIIETGTGPVVSNGLDTVLVSYTGKTLDGVQFDKGDSVLFSVWRLIPGFQWGLTKSQAGGHVEVVMPSYMAYGCGGSRDQNGATIIKPNEPLYFDIKLLEVRNYRQ